MSWPSLRKRYERWFQGWLVLAPVVGFGSTTLVKNQLYRVFYVMAARTWSHYTTDDLTTNE